MYSSVLLLGLCWPVWTGSQPAFLAPRLKEGLTHNSQDNPGSLNDLTQKSKRMTTLSPEDWCSIRCRKSRCHRLFHFESENRWSRFVPRMTCSSFKIRGVIYFFSFFFESENRWPQFLPKITCIQNRHGTQFWRHLGDWVFRRYGASVALRGKVKVWKQLWRTLPSRNEINQLLLFLLSWFPCRHEASFFKKNW